MEFNANGTIVDVEDIIKIASQAAEAIKRVYYIDVEVATYCLSDSTVKIVPQDWTSKCKDDEPPLAIAQALAHNIIETGDFMT